MSVYRVSSIENADFVRFTCLGDAQWSRVESMSVPTNVFPRHVTLTTRIPSQDNVQHYYIQPIITSCSSKQPPTSDGLITKPPVPFYSPLLYFPFPSFPFPYLHPSLLVLQLFSSVLSLMCLLLIDWLIDSKTATAIAPSIVHFKLDYCNSLYYSLPKSNK